MLRTYPLPVSSSVAAVAHLAAELAAPRWCRSEPWAGAYGRMVREARQLELDPPTGGPSKAKAADFAARLGGGSPPSFPPPVAAAPTGPAADAGAPVPTDPPEPTGWAATGSPAAPGEPSPADEPSATIPAPPPAEVEAPDLAAALTIIARLRRELAEARASCAASKPVQPVRALSDEAWSAAHARLVEMRERSLADLAAAQEELVLERHIVTNLREELELLQEKRASERLAASEKEEEAQREIERLQSALTDALHDGESKLADAKHEEAETARAELVADLREVFELAASAHPTRFAYLARRLDLELLPVHLAVA